MAGAELVELWPRDWTARGVVATLEPLAGDERRERLLAVTRKRVGSVTVLMDAPHDPHNGSAVLRTCDAFGLPLVHVVRRGERFLVARKVTKGSERWVEVHEHATVEHAVAALAQARFELVATHPEGLLVPEDLAQIPRLALVLGNEHDGIREELRRAAPRAVRIPMRGFVESLNVSVAAAVLLRAATNERPGDLSDDEQARAYARALCRSVPRAAEILAGRAPL
ncbi:MAG TPA: RNA methyltransferase [Polyangiaceae bacterium]|jgi:tRNA (guanosine-2'-O-)-methyltransferase